VRVLLSAQSRILWTISCFCRHLAVSSLALIGLQEVSQPTMSSPCLTRSEPMIYRHVAKICTAMLLTCAPILTHAQAGVCSTPGVPVYAQSGQIVDGFPTQLILDKSAQIIGSYSICYSASSIQYTVAWNSSSSISTLDSAYKQYLSANGWPITNEITQNYPSSLGTC
jgi:hypothetical protein